MSLSSLFIRTKNKTAFQRETYNRGKLHFITGKIDGQIKLTEKENNN